MKILFRNASILKMDGSPILYSNLVVEDNRISYIGSEYEKYGPFDRVIECEGNLIMPSFKNAHSHNAMSFLRSKADDDTLHDWLFKQTFPREEKLTPEDIYRLSKVSILEQLTSGISASLDQYYYPLELRRACLDMGFRCCIQGTINKETSVEDLVRLYKELNVKDSLVRYSIGYHSEYTSSLEELKAIKKALTQTKSGFQAHIAETKAEVESCIKQRGMSPVKYFDSLGLFKYGGVSIHSVYLSAEDIHTLWKNNVSIVTCPGSNLKLASGIAPVKKYLDEGLLVGIGTDGPSSNNCLDMFKEMQLVINLAKVQSNDVNAISAYDVLKMATVNGAKILGFNDADTLEVGKLADIIEIDLSRPSMQPINNVINNLVYSGGKDVIKLTMVNGKILYEDGKFYVGEDINSIYEKAQEISDRIDSEIE